MAVERSEDFIAWQKARILTRDIYAATKVGAFARDFDLVRQIRRASVSVMSNIAEGFERKRRQEFHQFLSIAKSSCAEVRSLLYVAWDAEYLPEATFRNFMAQAAEVGRIVGGLRVAVAKDGGDMAAAGAPPLRTQNSELRTSRSHPRG
jgi:four helix bundle protein